MTDAAISSFTGETVVAAETVGAALCVHAEKNNAALKINIDIEDDFFIVIFFVFN
jgi:hypothetical protein